MTMEVVNCFYEEKKNAEYLERQIEECPVREKRFIKRGIEYLYLKNVYDVTEIEDSLIDSYALWLQEHGIKDRKLIGVYQKSLRDWRMFHKQKEFVKLKEELEECDTVEQTLKNKVYAFMVEKKIYSLEEIDWDVRVSYEQYLEKTINKRNRPWYLSGLDKLKLFDIKKRNNSIRETKIRLKYQEKLTAAEIDLYMRELQKECVEIATFNDKVAEIHCFFRFLTARGYYSKVPFYSEYYIKREPVPHHYRSVPQNTVTEILQNLNQLPEDMRLMYLHLWCLGLRINEVCSIKREGYYLKEGVAWLRIYQHKMKMEKVIPIPMILYRSMMVYIERKKIGIDSYVFQNSKGGPFLSTHYWHEMVAWCKKQGIRCGDHVFQTHDYRHSVATALYERGASIQAIREFLGHKHENMTRRYIDCIQKHVDMSSEQYYKEQKRR